LGNLTGKRLLVADNSSEYRRSVVAFLELEGYTVVQAGTPEDALTMLEIEEVDLVLADLRLRSDIEYGDMSGFEIAKFASKRGIPCIIVTAFPTVELARLALRSRGAEPFAKDLITKSSGPQALLDSISLVLRHEDSKPSKSVTEGLYIDTTKRLIWKNGELIELSKKQYALLEELHKSDSGVSTFADVIKAVYGETLTADEAQNDRRLKNLVDRVKEKLEDRGIGHEYIERIPGRGFRLNTIHSKPTSD